MLPKLCHGRFSEERVSKRRGATRHPRVDLSIKISVLRGITTLIHIDSSDGRLNMCIE